MAVFGPEVQAYPTPPLAVRDVVFPLQTEVAPAIAAVGAAKVLTIFIAEPVQPLTSVAVTV